MKPNRGFVLVEILIALAILSIVLISVISGVTSSIYVISGMKNYTHAMLIARTKMNDFIIRNQRGTDLKNEPVKEYENFSVTRVTEPFDHPMLSLMGGPLASVKITNITVSWEERGKPKDYTISYIYQAR
ncbi:MAG: prepilin-type N-terminal cleavage/methylation domain-containing protein [Spirochaetes bacterium]|nr:prepilin-type N-terminal cleavage/methylation domain-containing protein [Spirochaetota bacterium]